MNYKVYQDTELKQTVTSKTAVMNGLQPNKSYVFGVQPDDGKTDFVGANLIVQSDLKYGFINRDNGSDGLDGTDFDSDNYIATNGATVFTFSSPDYVFKGSGNHVLAMYDSDKNYLGYQPITSATQTLSKSNVAYIRFSINFTNEGGTDRKLSDWLANHRYKLEKGSVATTYVATTSVTTRGIRFNIPKTLTVDSTITLRYEEYPLGIVPIGNEPSGMFGGGNKQNLSAKVISTANGSSVVEVAGNVIDVGGKNLLIGTSSSEQSYTSAFSTVPGWDDMALQKPAVNVGSTYTYSINLTKLTGSFVLGHWGIDSNKKYVGWFPSGFYSSLGKVSWTFTIPSGISYIVPHVAHNPRLNDFACTAKEEKLEPGSIATPYASFVDGDTFTAQPDGTCALFSEYKAIYY